MVETLVMSMNIKNPEAHRLAREITAITGESVTEAVTVALRERLERIGQPQRRTAQEIYDSIREISLRTAPLMAGGPDAAHSADFLYDDETGLPK
jgi:antitoxin VapB